MRVAGTIVAARLAAVAAFAVAALAAAAFTVVAAWAAGPSPVSSAAGAGRPEPAARTAQRASLPLAGKVVGIDPGHNGRNWSDPSFISKPIWNGRAQETCDTTGTATNGGYSEAQFNWNVAGYLAGDLRAQGARVVLTRSSNNGVGPCVTTRAQIINSAHANVAIDIHADGGPASGRGFAILEPVADGPNDRVITSSMAFGAILRADFQAVAHMPISNYLGSGGVMFRNDLAGLNLTTVPKVLIECGNMRNSTDAALLVSAGFQKLAAKAMAAAITQFLVRR